VDKVWEQKKLEASLPRLAGRGKMLNCEGCGTPLSTGVDVEPLF
jgi:hypothetical protein